MKNVLKNKIDFMVLITVKDANPNGNPLDGNRPRVKNDGRGEITAECIKRKIRNRLQDAGEKIFVQSEDRCDDGCDSLNTRARTIKEKDKNVYAEKACKEWIDVRSLGQVFALKGEKKGEDGVSIGVRGPVSLHNAVSVSPVNVESKQITKSVNGEPGEKKSSDTMGYKHSVEFGLYVIKGSINVQMAEKTGFTEEDAEKIKEALTTLFVNDASSARPDGSMEVVRLYWWKHNCKDGQHSAAKVHKSIQFSLKEGVDYPTSYDDYNIIEFELPGLIPEVIEGI